MYQEKPWLDWPFFDAKHRELARAIDEWCARELRQPDHGDVDAACRELVKRLGAAGWLRYAIGGVAYGATADTIDTRAICLLRETLARHSGLADFASGMPT